MKKFLTILLSFSVSLLANAQNVEHILESYLTNSGGGEKWEEMETIITTGRVISQQGEFDFTTYAKAPDKMKVIVDIQGKKLVSNAYDGEIAWSLNPFSGNLKALELPEEAAEVIAEEAMFEPEYFDYKDKGHSITLVGKAVVNGTDTYELKVVKNANNEKRDFIEHHFFDAETFLPILIKTTALLGPEKGTKTEIHQSDFRKTGYGVTLPYRIETHSDGQVTQTLIIEGIVINEDIDNDIFEFPEDLADEVEDVKEELEKATEGAEDVPQQEKPQSRK